MGLRTGIAVAVAATMAMYSASAFAVIPITPGTPIGNATDATTIAGVYTTLPMSPAQPFAVPLFVLSLTLPQAVSIQNAVVSGFILQNVSGYYSNNGQTESFANGALLIQDFSSSSQLTLSLSHFLTTTDQISLATTISGHLYSFSQNNTMAVINPGSYAVTGNGDYTTTGDPPFAGTLGVTPNSATVPEPSSWTLMLAGFGGVGLVLRRLPKRRGARHITVRLSPA